DRTQAVLAAVRIGIIRLREQHQPRAGRPSLANGADDLFRGNGADAILGLPSSAWRAGGERPRTAGGRNRSAQLNALKTWLMAKLNIKDERGANMVEYVFLLALIALVVIVVVRSLGHTVSSKFSGADSELKN